MDTDKRKRTRIPVKKLPPVEWLLKSATIEQLQYLSRIGRGEEFATFVNLISKFKDYNVYEIYRYQAKDPEDLAYFRAAKVGEVAGLDALILACQGAQDEIVRRRKLREVKE